MNENLNAHLHRASGNPQDDAIPGIHGAFSAVASAYPDHIALCFEGSALHYRELDRQANRIAHGLLRAGIRVGDRVGIYSRRSLSLVPAILGTLKAGACYVPLDPDYPESRLAFLLEDSQPGVVLVSAGLENSLPTEGPFSVLSPEGLADDPTLSDEDPRLAVPPTSLAYVIYTSGSTGTPKGVKVTHRNVLRLFTSTADLFGFQADDVWTLFHSYAFDFSVWEIFGALLYGSRLVVVPHLTSRSPRDFRELLKKEAVTVLNQTPSAFLQLQAAEVEYEDRLPLRHIVFGGEALRLASLGPWVEKYGDGAPALINMYGITETTVHVTYRRILESDVSADRGSLIGGPIPDLALYVVGPSGQLAAKGEAGELYVGGAGVTSGYLGRPDLTAQRFVRNPFGPGMLYRTGDRVRESTAGDFEYLGRLDDQVQLRGFRIELGEVAAALSRHPGVLEAVAMLREDRQGDPRIVAYYVSGDDAAPSSEAILAEARRQLPDYMVPSHALRLKHLPLTAHGKVDRDALPAPDPKLPASPSTSEAGPSGRRESDGSSDLETFLVDVWSDVLASSAVGPDSDFFLEGGHSLLAIQAMGALEEKLGMKIPFRLIFQHSTPATLARAVKDHQGPTAAGDPQPDNTNVPAQPGEAAKTGTVGADRRRPAPPIQAVPRDRPIPLSHAQQRMWFIERLEDQGNLYNIPMAFELLGPLDRDALKRSLGALVDRHEILRSRFPDVEGVPYQAIAQPSTPEAWELTETDWAGGGDLEGHLKSEATRPFDLASGPLFRAGLHRRGENDHVLQVVMHHTISDGWSLSLFRSELGALYRSFTADEPSPLSPLEVQYADYTVWHRNWLQGDILEEQLGYWRDQLSELEPLELPTDRPRPAEQSFRGGNHRFRLPEDLTTRIRRVGLSDGSTLFMTLMTAFQVLVHRYSGQADIAVGTPVAGRNQKQLKGLLGMFVNTLVIRSDLAGNPTFRDLLRNVRSTALDAQAHQDLPFEKLVEELQPKRDLSRNPLFQVMFGLQNMPDDALTLPDIVTRPLELGADPAEFDLALFLWEDRGQTAADAGGGLEGTWSFALDLFDESTIERMQHHFHCLLEGIVANPDTRIGDLPLMTAAEQQSLVEEWSRGPELKLDEGVCIQHLFEARANEHPDRVAVVADDGQLTYGELDARANQLAHHLIDLGVGPEALVGISLPRSTDMVMAVLGVLKAGGAYLPLDPDLPVDRLAYMLEDGESNVLVTTDRGSESFSSFRGDLVCLDAEASPVAARSRARPATDSTPDDLAYVIYTSGSTGRPKGVEIIHRTAVGYLKAIAALPAIEAHDVVLATATLSFDASMEEIFGALSSGARLVVASSEAVRDGKRLMDLLEESGATFLDTTPAIWEMLIEAGWSGDKNLRGWSGAEVLPPDLARALASGLREAWNTYGPTEATVGATAWRIPEGTEKVRLGTPIANYRTYVLDDRMQPVPVGVPGELYIGGVGVARGYRNRPELTAERFVHNPFAKEAGARLYRTGDQVRFRDDGNLEFLGRLDNQVKIRGLRIELGEIEAVLREHDAVRNASVQVIGSGMDARLVGYVVYEPGPGLTSTEARRFLRRSLPDYMVPGLLIELQKLPLTPSGKLDRSALPDPLLGGAGSTPVYSPPVTEEERLIAEVWKELLELDQVGRTDNFFEVGGHSLLSIRAVSAIESRSGKRLDPRAMFFQTLEQLAASLTPGERNDQ